MKNKESNPVAIAGISNRAGWENFVFITGIPSLIEHGFVRFLFSFNKHLVDFTKI